MEDRAYQSSAMSSIRNYFKKGEKKVLLHLATGGGKTVVFCEIMKATVAKGKKAIMVVHGKNLVDQASQRLLREGVQHGVIQANHWLKNLKAPIQICSITTLYKRKIAPETDLVVIDEAHLAQSKSFKWLAEQYQDKFFLPVTATPYPVHSLRHIANVVVKPITVKELISQGYLVNARYFAPSKPNLDNVSIDSKTKDYNLGELATACNTDGLVGDVVNHYKKLANDLPAICFAVNKKHSKFLVEKFLEAGISAIHVEDKTGYNERKSIMEKHASGEIKVICNVNILCTGVDMPYLRAVIMARPTKSKILFIQQAGRGTRPYKDKPNFLLIDHARNIEQHGFITQEHEAELDGKPKKTKEIDLKIRTCENCFAVYGEDDDCCPECGYKKPAPKRDTSHKDGELVEIQEKEVQMFHSGIPGFDSQIVRWIDRAEKSGYAPGWVFHEMKKKYGQQIAEKHYYAVRNYMPKSLRDRKPRATVATDIAGDRIDSIIALVEKRHRDGLS